MNEEKAWGLFRMHIGAVLGENFRMYGMADNIPSVVKTIEFEAKNLLNNLEMAKNKEKTREHASSALIYHGEQI